MTFFSSRRRHTRYIGDWSSDVCSSDLNGFQILCGAGLLPGAFVRNRSLKFICRPVHLRVETTETPFTNVCRRGQVLEIPIAHGDGNYVVDPDTLSELEQQNRIVFRYSTPAGRTGRGGAATRAARGQAA